MEGGDGGGGDAVKKSDTIHIHSKAIPFTFTQKKFMLIFLHLNFRSFESYEAWISQCAKINYNQIVICVSEIAILSHRKHYSLAI